MKRGRMAFSGLVVLIVVCVCISSSYAGTVEIKEMQFSFIGLSYYSNQTLGFSQGTSLVADIAIPTGPDTVDYAYTIQDAVMTLSNMSLTDGFDTAAGTFDGPATLTVTGNLINSTSTNLTGNVTLLVASMDSSNLVMSEVFSQFAAGSALFTTYGGALFDGVADGGDTLVLRDFGMGLWGSGVDVLFGNNSMSPPTAGVQITIPEPATMGLLSMGMLILLRKRNA